MAAGAARCPQGHCGRPGIVAEWLAKERQVPQRPCGTSKQGYGRRPIKYWLTHSIPTCNVNTLHSTIKVRLSLLNRQA